MKILYVVSYSPWPVSSGGAWRLAKSIEHLSKRHELTVALCREDDSIQDRFVAEGDGRHARRVLKASPRPPLGSRIAGLTGPSQPSYTPFADRLRWRRSILEACAEVDPDVVWFAELSTFWRCGPVRDRPVVSDLVDIQAIKEARTLASELGLDPADLMLGTDGLGLLHRSDLARKYRSRSLFGRRRRARYEAIVLQVALAERWAASGSNAVLMANPEVTSYIDPLAQCLVAPNGFDFGSTFPHPDPSGETLVFFGQLRYRPNIDGLRWFCERVWPHVLRRRPDARLEVIGQYDERLAFADAVPGVVLRGFVERLGEIAARSSALVVPLLSGGGTRFKILEAWARRLPVISTPIGCEGLGARDAEHLLVAHEPTEFAQRCVELLDDPMLGRRLAAAGFEHGRRYDWQAVLPRLEHGLEVARTSFLASRARGQTVRARLEQAPIEAGSSSASP